MPIEWQKSWEKEIDSDFYHCLFVGGGDHENVMTGRGVV